MKNILSKNLYFKKFIKHNINKRINYSNNQNIEQENNKQHNFDANKIIVFPYYENIIKIFSDILIPLNFKVVNNIPY